ncbi:MAG: YqjD family protein [Thermoanaerobaculia bacterium]
MANSTVEDAAKTVEQKIDATRESMGERTGRLRERVGDVAENVRARAGALKDKIADTDWEDVQQGVKNYVRDNPGKSLALALGVGFALGLLLRRRDD